MAWPVACRLPTFLVGIVLSLYRPLPFHPNPTRPRLAGLRALHHRAKAWLDTARPVLEQDYVTDDQLPLLLALIAAGEEVGVAMEQLEILKANVEVSWRRVCMCVGVGVCAGRGPRGRGWGW